MSNEKEFDKVCKLACYAFIVGAIKSLKIEGTKVHYSTGGLDCDTGWEFDGSVHDIGAHIKNIQSLIQVFS